MPSGEHSYHKSWPLHVKVLARLGHLLPFVEPADCTALLQLASEHEVYKAGEPVGIAGAYMFVAHLMKWPPVVYEFSRRLRLQLADHPGVGCTAAELVSLYQAMIEFSSGSRWSEMFDRMNGTTSLMDAQTGLSVFASRLALLTKREEDLKESPESEDWPQGEEGGTTSQSKPIGGVHQRPRGGSGHQDSRQSGPSADDVRDGERHRSSHRGIQRDRRRVLHKHVALAVLQRRTGGVWRRITSVGVEGAIFQKLVR